jgi:hypothetical protein
MDVQMSDAIAMAPTGEVSVTGFFYQGIDFGTGLMTSAGEFDAYIAGIGQ